MNEKVEVFLRLATVWHPDAKLLKEQEQRTKNDEGYAIHEGD